MFTHLQRRVYMCLCVYVCVPACVCVRANGDVWGVTTNHSVGTFGHGFISLQTTGNGGREGLHLTLKTSLLVTSLIETYGDQDKQKWRSSVNIQTLHAVPASMLKLVFGSLKAQNPRPEPPCGTVQRNRPTWHTTEQETWLLVRWDPHTRGLP